MDGLVVETQCGKVRGVVETSTEGFDYVAFKGIPYAEPPIGDLRFKDPVPVKKWSVIKDATKYGPICVQHDMVSGHRGDSEDCLYLNVYVKSAIAPHANKAVMVWIHGGAFIFGNANDVFFGPDYLVEKDVILVSVNYRLGVLGFLNLEDAIAPGNMGLKDQTMALQWVRDNISNFGGNPNKITIFGESAGGCAVHYLALSHLSKGLFQQAISQSGSAFAPWAITVNSKMNAIQLCKLLGEELSDSKAILEFLKTIDCKKLHEAQEKLRVAIHAIPFGPGVDDKSPNPFMPRPVNEVAEEGVHIPYLSGYNGREGIILLLDKYSFEGAAKEDVFKMMDENFEHVAKSAYQTTLKRFDLTPKQLKRLYYKSESISLENCDKFVDMMGELYFVEPIHKLVKVQVEKSTSSTYLYQFTYDPGFSLIKSMTTPKFPGASHFDDTEYLFKMRYYDEIGVKHLEKGSKGYKIMQQMTEMWTNFAKYGQPTFERSDLIPELWLPVVNGMVLRYLNIDEDVTMQNTLNVESKFVSGKSIK